MSDQPKPHINGVQPPAVGRQEQVPAHSGAKHVPAQLPEKGTTLPKTIVK